MYMFGKCFMKRFLLLLAACFLFTGCSTVATPGEVACSGVYFAHLQGVAMNENNEYFWSYTTELVKTDADGEVLAYTKVGNHHGDLACYDGKLYCAVSEWSDYSIGADEGSAKVMVYSQDDLELLGEYSIDEANGIDGITVTPRGFLVAAEPIPAHQSVENYLLEYDRDFNLIAKHPITTPPTSFGAQAITNTADGYIITYYGNQILLLNRDFEVVTRYKGDAAIGVIADEDRGFAKAWHVTEGNHNWTSALKLKKWSELTETTLEELVAEHEERVRLRNLEQGQ